MISTLIFDFFNFMLKTSLKVPKRVLDGHSISRFARKRTLDGHIPDTPPGSASRALSPYANQMAALLVGGGEKAEILLAGRLLKILIKLGLIFNIKFIH